jgi:hypothetical protein
MSNTSIINKQANDYELIAMSWHEAAHVICGLHNFMRIYDVCVISEKYDHGNTSYEIYNPDNITNKLLAKILLIFEVQTLYAGLVGEKLYYQEICGSDNFPMHLRIGSSDDIRDAAKLISTHKLALPGKARFLFKKQIQNDTHNILINYWEDIKLISHMLYKHKELNEGDLKHFLTRYSDNKDFWRSRFKAIKTIYSNITDLDEKYLKEIIVQNSIIII